MKVNIFSVFRKWKSSWRIIGPKTFSKTWVVIYWTIICNVYTNSKQNVIDKFATELPGGWTCFWLEIDVFLYSYLNFLIIPNYLILNFTIHETYKFNDNYAQNMMSCIKLMFPHSNQTHVIVAAKFWNLTSEFRQVYSLTVHFSKWLVCTCRFASLKLSTSNVLRI